LQLENATLQDEVQQLQAELASVQQAGARERAVRDREADRLSASRAESQRAADKVRMPLHYRAFQVLTTHVVMSNKCFSGARAPLLRA
jgi:septal ring factor EnvC (AmiA/AmiB activator)